MRQRMKPIVARHVPAADADLLEAGRLLVASTSTPMVQQPLEVISAILAERRRETKGAIRRRSFQKYGRCSEEAKTTGTRCRNIAAGSFTRWNSERGVYVRYVNVSPGMCPWHGTLVEEDVASIASVQNGISGAVE